MTRNHVGRRWSYHPFLLPCGCRYTNVVYIGNSADTFVGLSSQDNSRRPPLRLEWRERTSIEESDDGVEDRGVARAGGRPTHTSAHFHTCRGTHTHTITRAHARTHLGYNRPAGRADPWSDLRSWFAASRVVTILQTRLCSLIPPLPCDISIKISLVCLLGCR